MFIKSLSYYIKVQCSTLKYSRVYTPSLALPGALGAALPAKSCYKQCTVQYSTVQYSTLQCTVQ